jgi:LysR family glycine cleavage system transcriptional activator
MVVPSHLRSLQALDAAVRHGSFSAAAGALGITAAAVGQRVKALEDYLGIELLVRGRSGIRPSPELMPALAHLRQGFDALQATARELELQRGRELHVAAVSDFADLWLKPRLPAFRAAHPNIRFCINGEGEAPMRLGRVDCEISFAPIPDPADGDLLFRDFVVPLASPENLARTASIEPRRRLEGFPLVHLDFYKDDPAGISWPQWIAANGHDRTAPERGMRFQRITAARDAVLANAGVTLGSLALLGEPLSAGAIALAFPVTTGQWTSNGFVARFRSDSAPRPHVRRFREWLAAEAQATRAALDRWASGAAPLR